MTRLLFPMTRSLFQRLAGLAWFAYLLISTSNVYAQVPNWHSVTGITNTTVNATVTDTSGNVYLAGFLEGYDTASFGNIRLIGADQRNLFIAKWNPVTGFAWAEMLDNGGPRSFTNNIALAVRDSSVYVASGFSGTAHLGPITLQGASRSIFVAKAIDRGHSVAFRWAQHAGSSTGEYMDASSLGLDGANVYVAGTYSGKNVSFGGFLLPDSTYGTGYVAKLHDAGSSAAFEWVQPIAPTSSSRDNYAGINALTVSAAKVYVAGYFADTVRFGSITQITTENRSAFVAKLSDGGTTSQFDWVQQANVGFFGSGASALAVSGSRIYITGTTYDTVAFGPFPLPSHHRGIFVFVARLTDAGTSAAFDWVQTGGSGSDRASALAIVGNRVYATGCYGNSSAPYTSLATFGSTVLSDFGGYGNGFIARLIDGGSSAYFDWATDFGGRAFDMGHSLGIGPANKIYIGGHTTQLPSRFGPLSLTSATPFNGYTGFLAALTDPTLGAPEDVSTPTFTLAPNPTRATAYLTGAAPGTRFTLLDALGRTVLTATATPDGTATFDVRALPAGLYLVRAEGKAGARRLVVE